MDDKPRKEFKFRRRRIDAPETKESLVRHTDGSRSMWNVGMCEKYVDFDSAIERYRDIVRSIKDQPTVDRAKELIAELEAQKTALHPRGE
jgi:hypothetical protein